MVEVEQTLVTTCLLGQNPYAESCTHSRTMGHINLLHEPHLTQTQLVAVYPMGVIMRGLEVLRFDFTGF